LVQHEFCWTPFLWAFGYSVYQKASQEFIFPLDFDPSKVGSDKFLLGREDTLGMELACPILTIYIYSFGTNEEALKAHGVDGFVLES
jgi:hypothetical protein